MPNSNFTELRRIRSEMSTKAGHNVRRYIELLAGVREKYRDQLVNHGAEADRSVSPELPTPRTCNGESTPAA
jgi:hypothetical protein